MGLFDTGAGLTSTLGASANAIGAVSSAVGTASRLSSAIASGFNSDGGGNIAGAIRSINLPAAGEAIGDIMGAISEFTDSSNANDWRVRLSMAKWTSFRGSPVLQPLKDAGGLIFPYTPKITIASKASYQPISTTHTNYTHQAFKNSDPGSITIVAPMWVSDAAEGLYWIAMVHYLRSLTKMFSGNDPKAGNPPPVIMLNGYGNYVFKNVPVVVTSMSVSLENTCDYISVPVVGSAAGEIEGLADSIGGTASALGGLAGGAFGGAVGSITGAIGSIAGGIGQVAGLAGSLGLGGSVSGGTAHVPTKSSFQVTLQPIYSRNSSRKFSLDRFVSGGYLNSPVGYI
jgi:hypothetical protein